MALTACLWSSLSPGRGSARPAVAPERASATRGLARNVRPPAHSEICAGARAFRRPAQVRSGWWRPGPVDVEGALAKVGTQPSVFVETVFRLSTAVRSPARPYVAEGSSTRSATQAERPVFAHARNTPGTLRTESSPLARHPDPQPPHSRVPACGRSAPPPTHPGPGPGQAELPGPQLPLPTATATATAACCGDWSAA